LRTQIEIYDNIEAVGVNFAIPNIAFFYASSGLWMEGLQIHY